MSSRVGPFGRSAVHVFVVSAVGLALGACSSDGRTLRAPTFPLPSPPVTEALVSPEPLLTALLPSEPLLTPALDPQPTDEAAPSDGRITIDRLHSPANATAEMSGVGAMMGDRVTVDGTEGDVLAFDVNGDATFTMQVWIPDEGAHTVCVADTCGRVYTLAPDADSPEQVIAKIEAAMPLAEAILPYGDLFPEWTIEIGGALSGTGGSTDPASKVVTIYRNRGRTVEEFVRTILHEIGHVADYERLTDDERGDYLELRGLPVGTPWRDEEAHRLDDWGRQPSEDFAEVMVKFWTNGLYEPRTAVAVAPDPATLEMIARLAEFG